MEFRWIAILALWTMLIGPVLYAPRGVHRPSNTSSVGAPGQTK